MQLDPSNSGPFRSFSGTTGSSASKRTHPSASSNFDDPSSSSFPLFEDSSQRPPKLRRLSVSTPMPPPMDRFRQRNAGNQSSSSAQPSGSGSGPHSSRGRQKQKGKQRAIHQPNIAVLPEPLHDAEYIRATYKTKTLKGDWEQNPKSPLTNFLVNTLKDSKPVVAFSQGLLNGNVMVRFVD